MEKILSNLIKKHFYSNREEAQAKIDTCFAMGKLTQDAYSNLVLLLDEYYPEAPEAEEETKAK